MKMAQLLELLDVSDSPLFWDLPLMSDDEAREILAQALTQLGAMDAMAPSESPAEELAAQLVQFVVEKGDDDAERKKSVSVGEAIDLAEKIYAGEVVLPRMVVFSSLVNLGLIDASPSDSVWQVSSHWLFWGGACPQLLPLAMRSPACENALGGCAAQSLCMVCRR